MRIFTLLLATALTACASAPPTAPKAAGEITPANGDPTALNELVRAAVAATKTKGQRFTAVRGEKLRDVLQRWAKQEDVRLVYKTDFNPQLIDAVAEPDLIAAGVALSVLLQNEPTGAVLDFSNTKEILVRNFEEKEPK